MAHQVLAGHAFFAVGPVEELRELLLAKAVHELGPLLGPHPDRELGRAASAAAALARGIGAALHCALASERATTLESEVLALPA